MLRCPWWLIACFALMSCSREPQAPAAGAPSPASSAGPTSSPAATGAVPAAPVTADPAVATSANQPAESSLAIKRGVVSLAAGRTTYRPCDEKAELWLLDQTDGALRQIFPAANDQTNIYVEAYGERTQAPKDVATARGYPGALILEEVLYAAEVKEGDGCGLQPPAAYVVAARGGDPFWSAEIREKEITWRQSEAPTEILMQIPAVADAEGTVSYRGLAEGYELEMEIEGQPCRDAASGEYFAYQAHASLNGKEFNGCARVGS